MAGNQTSMEIDSHGQSAADQLENRDEEQLQEALNHLKLLHVKCRELRTMIPRMIQPLTTKNTPPHEALGAFRTSISSTSNELQDFRALYTSEESKIVFEQARKSREAEPKGIKPWRAKDHPDWLDLKS